MNLIKNNLRKSSMIDESSSACVLLKVTEYEPDMKGLASKSEKKNLIDLLCFMLINIVNNLYTVCFALVLFNVTA